MCSKRRATPGPSGLSVPGVYPEQQEDSWDYGCSGHREIGDEGKEGREARAQKALSL